MIKTKAQQQLEELTNKIKSRATTQPDEPEETTNNKQHHQR